jgi:16S rRNA (guanine1207-N2)-methyltransferase
MNRDAQKTLFHPFETGELVTPGADASVLFLGAVPGFHLPEGFAARITLIQGFRPLFRSLQGSGRLVAPIASEGSHDMALVLTGRHRGRNEAQIADAIERVVAGGLVLVAGSKDDGIGSLRKRVAALIELEGMSPKYHGLAFWFRRPDKAGELVAALRENNLGGVVEGRFFTAPGMFSHDRIDTGSRLLTQCLPDDLSGRIADFCAGWGYLAVELADRFSGLEGLDLYEADYDSVEASRRNLADAPHEFPVRFFWHDLLSEPVGERYDAIVMNPPFHQGRAAEPDIGQRLIAVAARSLRKGGRLLLVANRQLPYEQTIREGFEYFEETAREGGFKVLTAWR